MLVDSDNTASNMVLSHIGFDQVNALMEELGARDTKVERLFFDDAARRAGKDIRTSPRDIGLILRKLLQSEATGDTGTRELLEAMARNTDRDKLPAGVPAQVQVMNKTGVLPEADGGIEHDAGIFEIPGGH